KVASDPNSATSQFFFNLANNPALDSENEGFTVFGKLVGAADQGTIDKLAAFQTKDESNVNSSFAKLPMKNYTGSNFPTDTTAANFAMIKDVAVVRRDEFLTYSVVGNTKTDLVKTSIVD